VENEFSYRSCYHRIFAQLNRIGLIGQLNLAPKISFFHDHVPPTAVTYLEAPAHLATPAQSAAPAGTYSELESRVASLQAERDSLRVAMNAITQTRLWRMVAATYPRYQRVLGNRNIPRLAKRPIQAMGQWLAERKGK